MTFLCFCSAITSCRVRPMFPSSSISKYTTRLTKLARISTVAHIFGNLLDRHGSEMISLNKKDAIGYFFYLFQAGHRIFIFACSVNYRQLFTLFLYVLFIVLQHSLLYVIGYSTTALGLWHTSKKTRLFGEYLGRRLKGNYSIRHGWRINKPYSTWASAILYPLSLKTATIFRVISLFYY